ncbi:hypothetical protein EVAR_75631_1 [Eumeta japonica]|uniref:Uncharacterized protein n=1 Tax=Eumeta variegata TaxID=151549 RepID=A0A4C1U040_EUMVA|nr:hypothetical protein EVAR_75631_1 [Eumeta japonica]
MSVRASLGIGMSQIQLFLHKHLDTKKLCLRWIPHNLAEAQKADRVTWCNAILTRCKLSPLPFYFKFLGLHLKASWCSAGRTLLTTFFSDAKTTSIINGIRCLRDMEQLIYFDFY